MPLRLLLLFVLAVSGFQVDGDALFPRTDFDLFGYGSGLNTSATLQKRYDQARFTFFDVGLGACGKTNSPSDFIVALNSPQYGDGEHCLEMIQVTYNGKTAQAQIVDECPGCPWAALDFSTGLFDYFAPPDKGVIYGSWVFSGETKKKQTSTETQTPTPTPHGLSQKSEPETSSQIGTTTGRTSLTLGSSTSSATASATPPVPGLLNAIMESSLGLVRVIVLAQ